MTNKIRVVLPKKYDLVVGDTFQLFYRGVIEAPDPFCYSIVAVCEKGKSFPRYFEYTPENTGQFRLMVSVYDEQRNLLGSDESILNVVKPQASDEKINILCIGDSNTQGGEWVNEVQRRICENGGTPEGLGYSDSINFVGTCSRGNVSFEAYGGWAWFTYTSAGSGSMWIECNHTKTQKDQHSLWEDESGNIWQLETIETKYLKFNRYKEHTGVCPEKGSLKHNKNGINTENIEILGSGSDEASPFYNKKTNTIDFGFYAKRNGIKRLDAVYFFLGLNGLLRNCAMTLSRHDYCKIVVEEAKVLVNKIKEAFPDVLVKICGTKLPSVNGGLGTNYGAELPFCNYYDLVHYIMELNLAYEKWTMEEEYKDFMEFINVSGQFDSDYAYPSVQKSVNIRSNITERIDTNGVHPTNAGYMQIADAVYRNVVKTFFSEK